jgi:hypothetical protein
MREGIEVINMADDIWSKNLFEFNYSLFIAPEWVEAMASSFCSPLFLDFVQKEDVVGKISGLIVKKGWLKGDELFFYAAPALTEPCAELMNICCEALLVYAKSIGVQRVIIGSYDQMPDMKLDVKGLYTNERVEYVVDLQTELGEIAFSQNIKRNVKKAEKLSAIINLGTSGELLRSLFDLLGKTLQQRINKYGNEYNPFYLPYMNKESITRLSQSELVRMYGVTLSDEKYHSVLLNLEHDGKAFNLLVGSDQEAYNQGLPSFADYGLIYMYKKQGFKYYNLGGGTGDAGTKGLERSKLAKGAQKRIVYGATSNFLCFPHSCINPLLRAARYWKSKRILFS